jgi:hypothetical protein
MFQMFTHVVRTDGVLGLYNGVRPPRARRHR